MRFDLFIQFLPSFTKQNCRLRHSSQPADRLLGARLSTAFRVVFIVDIALIVAGASQTTTAQNYTTAEALIKAGYVVLGCIVLFLIVFTAYLWSMRGRVNSKYEKVCPIGWMVLLCSPQGETNAYISGRKVSHR